jgi:hypothetical protein
MKSRVIDAYLSYNITGIQKQLLCIASLVKEAPGKGESATDPPLCITKAVSCL